MYGFYDAELRHVVLRNRNSMRKVNCLPICWKKSLCFLSVARVFTPLSATGSLKLRSSEATVTPRSNEFKNYCRHDGIGQHQWDVDWGVSWLWPDRPLRRLPRKGANSRKAFRLWLRKTKEITPAKEFLEIRYSWLLFNLFFKTCSIAQFLAHKPVNFVSLTDSFIVSFSKLLKLWSST